MNDTKLKKSKTAVHGFGIVGAMLLLCVILSAIVLFYRLTVFTYEPAALVIPVAAYNTVGAAASGGESDSSAEEVGDNPASLPAAPSEGVSASGEVPDLQVSDAQKVWSNETEVEIFRISYENGQNEVTVAGNGDKLLAPGTENSYPFQIANTGTASVDYTMTMEAYFSHGENAIPIEVRVSDYEGNYFAGSENGWSPVMELNEVRDTAVLAANHYHSYTLTWQWPFEGDDTYDTYLGNLAAEEDLTLTVIIRIIAEADENPDAPGGIPNPGDSGVIDNILEFGNSVISGGGLKTGDSSNRTLWFLLAVVCLVGLTVMVDIKRRGKKR